MNLYFDSVSDFDAALPSSKESRYIMKLTLNQRRNSGEHNLYSPLNYTHWSIYFFMPIADSINDFVNSTTSSLIKFKCTKDSKKK